LEVINLNLNEAEGSLKRDILEDGRDMIGCR